MEKVRMTSLERLVGEESVMTKMRIAFVCLFALSAVAFVQASDVDLNAVLYPDGIKVPVKFETTDRAPKAVLRGEVNVQKNQAKISVDWSKLEPALLFGGDMNCWVLWVVTPDGLATNLGELPVRESRSGKVDFATPQLQFAIMVTAEPSIVVRKPSDVVGFVSLPTKEKKAKNSTFSYSDFRTVYTARDRQSIATMKYEDKIPVDLAQARKAISLMDAYQAGKYAPKPATDARVALGQAEDAYADRVGSKKDVPQLCARTQVLVAEAVRAAAKVIDAEKAQAAEAKRLSEMAALQAETEAERDARLSVEASLAEVERQRQALEVDRAKLERERDELAKRLSGALNSVASTQRTGRGMVVSLSGEILFDTGKWELKADAKLSLAKLAGILLMMPEAKVAIEGYTDSTGTLETNEKLSRERANSVMTFLQSQGVAATRMTAQGLGPSNPVASNESAEGRAKNRRVEIIIPDSTSTSTS